MGYKCIFISFDKKLSVILVIFIFRGYICDKKIFSAILIIFSFFKGVSQGRIMKTWCAEILLEKRQGGEIWGKVEWYDLIAKDIYVGDSLAVLV